MEILKSTPKLIEKYKQQFIELYDDLIYVHYPEKINSGILSPDDSKQQVEKIIHYVDSQQGIVFIAIDREKLCGYAHGYLRDFLDEKRLMVDGIVVTTTMRNKNIGKSLLHELEKYAIDEGCHSMELFVTTNNPLADQFYRNNGYIESRLHLVKDIRNNRK